MELKVYTPSDSLMKLSQEIKKVAGFDTGLVSIFARATKVNAVNAFLSHPDMADILDKLEGSSAGFSTDLAAKGDKYDTKTRNAAVTQALSLGAQLVNKEFGIIKGGMMLQKNYFQRTLDSLGKPGTYTSDCRYQMMWWDTENGEISLNGNMATIPMSVRYKLLDKDSGKELEEKVFSRPIQLKTYPTDGPDMWLGKAERRIWQKLLRYLSGIDFGEDGGDDVSSQAPVAPPPVGTVSLKKDAPEKPSAPTAEDAQFKDIVAAKATPVEATSKPQTKPYSEMNQAERAKETARVSAPATTKPELF